MLFLHHVFSQWLLLAFIQYLPYPPTDSSSHVPSQRDTSCSNVRSSYWLLFISILREKTFPVLMPCPRTYWFLLTISLREETFPVLMPCPRTYWFLLTISLREETFPILMSCPVTDCSWNLPSGKRHFPSQCQVLLLIPLFITLRKEILSIPMPCPVIDSSNDLTAERKNFPFKFQVLLLIPLHKYPHRWNISCPNEKTNTDCVNL